MYEKDFQIRLAKLRTQKGVSARDMSFSIGQNPSYINNIENGKALPSMSAFFFICEYLEVTPQEFFETSNNTPKEIRKIAEALKKLPLDTLQSISDITLKLADKQI